MKIDLTLSHKSQIGRVSVLISFLIINVYSILFAQIQENHKFNSEIPSVKTIKSFKLEDTVEIECGYYFDNNADGFVDSIYVEVTTNIVGGLTNTHVEEIINNAITLPSFRNLVINSSGAVSGGFYIDVTENNTNPTTYITADDSLTVKHHILSIGGLVLATTTPFYDRVAPIIHWDDKSAYMIDFQIDSIYDTLTVKFSEPITDVTNQEPFLFLSMVENTQYQVQLNQVSHINNDEMKFTVVNFNPVKYMRDGDSIWIQRTDRVGDAVSPINYQNNNNNIRRKLWVERRLMPYCLIPNAVSPFDFGNINNNIIPTDLIDIMNNIDPNFINNINIQTNNNGEYIGMIITIMPNKDPDILLPDFKLNGFITIYDREGNFVLQKIRMLWWEKQKSLIWIWNIKNEDGYYVSPGVYNCFFEIEEVTPSLGYQNGGPKEIKRMFIGVKGAGSDSCGGCGTSAELAFIPPIGFKLASIVKRRKRWWHKLFKRLKAIIKCT